MPNPEKFEQKIEEREPIEKEKELEKAMEKHEYFSLFERVKNRAIFLNEKANIPLELKEKLELGKESPLGLFLKRAEPIMAKELGERNLETWPKEHGRSAICERMVLDKTHFYRDIDLKGIGSTVSVIETGTRREGYWGLLEKNDAFYDYTISEDFLKAGIRTLRVLAIIEPEEIILKGEKISLNEAKEKGIIKKEFQPVIEVRTFGTKARIRDFIEGFKEDEIKKLLLEDAKKLVSQEIGKDLSDNRDYLEWFAKTFGQNVGLMHKNGFYHGRLAPHESRLGAHNITLDCRIVDLGTVRKIKLLKGERFNNEKEQAISSCLRFAHQLGIFKDVEVRKKFEEDYNAVFSPEEGEKFFGKK